MASEGMTTHNQGRWDRTTQTYHGGQDWRNIGNFIEDFSVTTNGLGTPANALEAARRAVDEISHYPPADFEPALTHLASFLWPEQGDTYKPMLLLGNGASELIDLVIRQAKPGKWRPGNTVTQYKEYERSAKAAGFTTTDASDASASLLCMVNPTNPTGDYMSVEAMKAYIEGTSAPGTTVIVDESMQPWIGPHWRHDSLIHQREWVARISAEKGVHVWVMTSWTKIWSCTGIRLGSVVAPNPEALLELKAKQVPWSVNCVALAFLSSVVHDEAYLASTWELTPQWNKALRTELNIHFPSWTVHGEVYLSWVWVDTHDVETTTEAVRLASAAGTPVRSAGPGYNMPTFFRIAVRDPKVTNILLGSLRRLAK
ncbi:hypothetical protein NSK_006183 [Nannochloropsis salina CCMP1776]|uniref:Aminotransferase class I/classII large domain-containing protein n=1 Tax=Nannochloropsis salina CCMP1776 TaxID=1027361 RepID=A0A4D9CV94_9STRA|nr:hypothetical protein NSK_006183 [Nannochloropsis salina CCMP1776]|eukprot:TFJ82504.1 hypothetical protein NSK_006183 [Nannochloropsis salina CCMP1776]